VRDYALSPKVAVLYKLDDNVSLFGSVARTERLPTLDELYSYSATQAPAIALERETSLNMELGLALDRRDLFRDGDSLQLKLTAFQNDVENLIQRTAAAHPMYFESISAARFRGLELEAGYEAERVFGRLAWSKIEAWDTTYDYRLNSNPADRLVLVLGGRAPDRGLEYGWRGTFVEAITTASRSTSTGVITPTSYDGYVTHDLFLRWTPQTGLMGGFSLDMAVENLTDALYRNNLAKDNGPGRTFKVSLARTF
jgi:hemoglobin/transferrin/lactoferrin receptor protein